MTLDMIWFGFKGIFGLPIVGRFAYSLHLHGTSKHSFGLCAS